MGAGHSKNRSKIDQFFREEANAYTQRKAFKSARVIGCTVFLLIVLILGLVLTAPEKPTKSPPNPTPALNAQSSSESGENASPGKTKTQGSPRGGFFSSAFGIKVGGLTGGGSSRNRTADQVIRRGAGSDPAGALPLGYAVSVKLLNNIRSNDTSSPVIAEVVDDVYSHGSISIPAKTHAIGTVRFDDASRRLQIKFATLVYPEGEQHSIQAVGMMPDGSAGIDGDYHSGEVTRQTGQFLGNFIGAMADGMRDQLSGGPFGMPYSPGSLKNGLLSGVSTTAESEAKSETQSLSTEKPSMTLSAGQLFLLFFEHEYSP